MKKNNIKNSLDKIRFQLILKTFNYTIIFNLSYIITKLDMFIKINISAYIAAIISYYIYIGIYKRKEDEILWEL